jgi:hypothetical protein
VKNEQPTVTLRPENPYYELFPNGIAPVRTPLPQIGEIETLGLAQLYLLDPSRLCPEQIDAIAARVAELFGADMNEVRAELLDSGLPIRASEVAAHPAVPMSFIL